ncbi:M56 family metallopeptidase [Pedobacter sp. Hv1]|uniref:M56 family metallopeptidase n=1 Tax=Pedobacter sp. Hv1 TaxID=1740090 RepID=UPI0006D89F5C|nr:M56 family metallopeptidase [Pedobacter sp. Hv1]KQB99999.1 hypothetical protein AQF98_15960 [Pedobacter sp. Hv1]
MIPYSLHVAIILAIWFIFYKLLLQKETYYRLNRVVLLGCLVLAFVLPLVPVPAQFSFRTGTSIATPVEVNVLEPQQVSATAQLATAKPVPTTVQPVTTVKAEEAPLTERLIKWAFWGYWCGVAILGANLLVQVLVLLYQAYSKPVMKDGIFRIVELDNDKAPCSFGNTIFINPSKYDWETYNQIIIHEKVHIQQGHSFDLMLTELVVIVQWFNPFAWLYRKELESNLEFLADHAVLNDHQVEIESYQLNLLKVAVPNWSMNITTNYNQSLLKKRIVMMSAKKSNVHIMWKYFVMLPMLVVLLAGLNKPVAFANVEPNTTPDLDKMGSRNEVNQSKGLWFATIKNDKINVEFKSDDSDENHRWSNSATFNMSEFSALPRNEKADFTITREAGTIVFNGKFDEDQGYGRYKFTVNKDFKEFAAFKNIKDMEDEEYFAFFMMDVKRSYVQFLNDNGFKDLTKNQIISMSAFKVNADDLRYWKKIGFTNLTPNNLVSLKSLKIDSVYVNDIRKAGYTDLTLQQLISFKSQRITGDYINSLRKAKLKIPSSDNLPEEKPTPTEIIRSKSLKVDTNYIAAVRDTGYPDLSSQTISTFKSQGVTAEFIKSFQDIGLKNLTTSNLLTLKNQNITAEFIKSFQQIGFKDVPLSTFYSLKSQKITPEFIRGYQGIGLKDLSLNTLLTLRSQNITPEYIKSFEDVGLKNIPFNTLYSLKSQGVTPEYIKSFKDIGFKDISYNQYYSLKTRGVTADFIKGFQKMGFVNVSINQIMTLRYHNVTPEFVADMKKKGFDLKDLDKYIQLKTLNTSSRTEEAPAKSRN